ncbi:helix-turn-helix domain-containing protein [Actinomycetes bacterium KLBMP 9759]
MTPRERLNRRESQARTRARLVEAAGEVFAERGVAGASVEHIVERAGYTRGAFYGNFADKEALVAALLEERTRRERDEVAALTGGAGSPEEVWAALRRWHHDRAEHVEDWLALRLELVLHTLRRAPGERSVLADRETLARETLTAAVRRELGSPAGSPTDAPADAPDATADATAADDRSPDPAFVALVVHALEDGLAVQRAVDPESVPSDAVVMATELVLRGARG